MPPRWGVWARLPSEGALIAARVPGGTGGSGEGGAGNKGERRLLSAVYPRNTQAIAKLIADSAYQPGKAHYPLPVTGILSLGFGHHRSPHTFNRKRRPVSSSPTL